MNKSIKVIKDSVLSTKDVGNNINDGTTTFHSLSGSNYGKYEKEEEEMKLVPPTAFGRRGQSNGSAAETIHSKEPPLVSYYKEKKEAIYKREPVGHSTKHNQFMNTHQKGGVRFGITTKDSEDAKEVLYPVNFYDELQNSKEKEEIYKKSHQSWEAGEQINRNYEWDNSGVNPIDHRFGTIIEPEVDGAKKTVQNYYQPPAPRELVHDIEVPKEMHYNDGRVFGVPGKADEHGSIDCIRGCWYGVDKTRVDYSMKSPILPGTEHLTFGRGSKKELGAAYVLSNRTTIPERDLPKSKDEIREFVEALVIEEGADFDAVFSYAMEHVGQNDKLSINQFLDCFRKLYLQQ